MRILPHWTALFIGALVLAPLAAEATLQLYVRYLGKRDRLIRFDSEAGWSTTPNLVTMQVNAAGEQWSVKTDQHGQRIIAQNRLARRRILILGDSLSFGEGVNVEDRFDVKMLPSLPGTIVINTGVMGYGTDQEYVVYRHWKYILKPGDSVLIVLNQSDYFDVLRRRFFGRAKPYFEKVDDSFVLRPPSTNSLERWSDRSLVARVAARFVVGLGKESSVSERLDLRRSIEIICFVLDRIREEAPRGVRVILAHQGTRDFLLPKLGLSSSMFCQFADVCIDLDNVLMAEPASLLPDGHWSVSGHAAVARSLREVLRD